MRSTPWRPGRVSTSGPTRSAGGGGGSSRLTCRRGSRRTSVRCRPGRCTPCGGAATRRRWSGSSAPVDVVHGTNFVVPPTRRAATVVSVHDLTPLHHPELCDEATLAYPGLIRRALARGAWVHTDSAFVAGEVVDAFGVDPARLRVVHPGIPDLPAVAERDAAAVLSRLLPSGSGRYCLAVGTAEPRKDLPGLVRAFGEVAARHGDLRLVLAGPPGWGEDTLAAAVAASPARDRIVRTGWVEPRDLAVAAVARQRARLPLPLRGVRLPAAAGDAGGRPGGRDHAPARCPRFSGTEPSWWNPATTTRWSWRSRPAWWTTPCAVGWSRPGRPGRRDSHGSAAAPVSRSSTATRREARVPEQAPSVLLVVEQLRRRVPGGIGVTTRGLLGGLARCITEGDGVDVTLLASRRRPSRRAGPCRGRSAGPLRQARPVVTAAGAAPDEGVGPRAGARTRGFRRRALGVARRAAPPALQPERARRHGPRRRLAPASRGHDARGGGGGTRRHSIRVRQSAASVVVPSRLVAADLESLGVDPARITVVPGGADHLPDPDPGATDALLARAGVRGEFLLTVGTLEPRKNVDRLVEAFGRVRPSLPAPVAAGGRGTGGMGTRPDADRARPTGSSSPAPCPTPCSPSSTTAPVPSRTCR